MSMELTPLPPTLILVSTLAALILACGSSLAYKIRKRRRSPAAARGKPAFFRRYIPPPTPSAAHRGKEGNPIEGGP